MKESDTDAAHQKQENESRGGRRDEGAASLPDGGEGTSQRAKLPFFTATLEANLERS